MNPIIDNDDTNEIQYQIYKVNPDYVEPPTPTTNLSTLPVHVNYLFNIINNANNIKLKPHDFILGVPGLFYRSDMPSINTSIFLKPIPLTGYTSGINITYARIDISKVFNAQTQTLDITGLSSVSDLIPQLNSIYNLDLDITDILPGKLPVINPEFPNLPLIATIVINNNSVKYTGTYDYILNYQQSIQASYLDAKRIVAIYSGNIDFLNSIVKYDMLGVIDTSFNFGNNLSSIITADITSAYYRNDGTICLLGVFTLTVLINNLYNAGIYNTLIVDETGTVIRVIPAVSYPMSATAKTYSNSNVPFIYSLDPSLPVPACLSRFNNLGNIDISLSYSLSFIPTMIRITNSGNIYVVSPVFSGIDPYNVITTPTPMVMITRLLPTGQPDLTFNNVLIRSSNIANPIANIVDIKENPNGLMAVLLSSLTGTDVGSSGIVVNGISLTPTDTFGNSLYVWAPIISLLNNGALNPAFNNYINFNAFGSSLFTLPTDALLFDSELLNYTNNNLTWLTYKSNPITTLESYIPITLNLDGSLSMYAFENYMSAPAYGAIYDTYGYSDGTMVISGSLRSVNFNGLQTPSKDMISILSVDRSTTDITSPCLGISPTGTVNIDQIFCF